tara:strand:+ start:524 stop:1189 length:666 start_codon:yes stop_codon:yes gene_type:complete
MKSKILLESWRSFINENTDSSPISEEEVIGLVPMSAKPFHEGHMSLIRKASDECNRVIVYVSISDRKRKGEITIFGEDMKYIWENILERSIKDEYPNVSFEYGGSPVGNVYKKLEKANDIQTEDVYRVYSDVKDTAKNYAAKYRELHFGDLYSRGQVIFPAEESPELFTRGKGSADISGKIMRSYLSNASEDKFLFLDSLPNEIKPDDKEEIFNILFRRLN